MLSHLVIPRALTECAWVLRPGGGMLTYQTFGTKLLEPNESHPLTSVLAIQGVTMSPATSSPAPAGRAFG